MAARLRLAAGAVAASLILSAHPALAADQADFKRQLAPIHSGRLFDLGVADYDGDGRQGLFTTNHKFLSAMSEFENGAFTDDLFNMGLSPSPDYPGFEDLLHRPTIDSPGLYLYADSRVEERDGEVLKDSNLHLTARDLDSIPLLDGSARARITLLSPEVRVVRSEGVSVQVSRDDAANPPRTVVDIEIDDDGDLEFVAKKLALPPIGVEIQQAPLLTNTYVGVREIRAKSPSFELSLRDRHGISWGDINADGITDAFITAGGVGGGIVDRYKGLVDDELLLSGGGPKLLNSTAGSGLSKHACRGRATALPDFDGDGDLDIFSSCENASPKLWRQGESGHFQGVSAPLRRAGISGSIYRWANLDPRPGLELVVGRKRELGVYARDALGKWTLTQRIPTLNHGRRIDSLTIGDFGIDGDPDLFVAAPSGNTLLVNQRGIYRPLKPATVGLPARSLFATWVDYDNDGRLDLHVLPDGLYHADKTGTFSRTGMLRMAPSALWGVAAWWDYDENGRRDVALAGRTGRGPRARARFYRNRGDVGQWLQVDVAGPRGGASALGAKVKVVTPETSYAGWVGESESSRFSSGNYRLFFGLGDQHVVQRVTVRWPDGSHTSAGPFATNQRLALNAPPSLIP